jgi:hypothetical protein
MKREARCPSHCAPDKTTMLAPMAQITCITTPVRPAELLETPRRKAPGGGDDEHLDEEAARRPRLNRKRAESRWRFPRGHQPGAGAGEKHEHRRAESA